VNVDTDRRVERRAAALAQPNAQERSNGAVKFACPACVTEGYDHQKDNAVYFPDTDKWSCAWAHDTALGRAHWDAIGAALGVFHRQNGSGTSVGRASSPPDDDAGAAPASHARPRRGRAAIVVRGDTVNPESMTWLDPGRLAVGALTMGVGLPDQGKTLITCDLMARMTAGSLLAPAPRCPGVAPPRRVLMLTNEDTLASTIVPRLIKAGADLSLVTFIQMVRDADGAVSLLTLQDDLDALEAALEHEGPELVAIDGLAGYLGDVKSHNDAEVRRVLSPFAAVLARTGTAGLGLMHPPKVTTNLHYYAGGSVAFTAIPRIVLGIAPDPEDASDTPRRFLAKLKGNLYGRVPTLAYRIVAEHDAAVPVIEWEPKPVTINIADIFDPPKEHPEERGQRRRCEAWLADYLADGPRHSREVEAAAEAAGFSKPTLRRARETMCDSVKGGAPGQGKQQWDWVLRPRRAPR
jgi:hypothetical protein